MHLEHTLVVMQYISRLADTALFAGGGDFGAGALTVAIQISTGRRTWGKAACVAAVGRTLQSYGMEGDWGYWDRRLGPKEAEKWPTELQDFFHIVNNFENIY